MGFSDSSSFATIFRKLSTKRLMLWQWQAMRSWSSASMAIHTYLGVGRGQGHSPTAAQACGHPSSSSPLPSHLGAHQQNANVLPWPTQGEKFLHSEYPWDIFRWCGLLPSKDPAAPGPRLPATPRISPPHCLWASLALNWSLYPVREHWALYRVGSASQTTVLADPAGPGQGGGTG